MGWFGATGPAGVGGFAGGMGGAAPVVSFGGGGVGGGGAGLGGAIFVQDGGSLTFAGTLTLRGNSVTGGSADAPATFGSAFGPGIFLQGNGTVVFRPDSGSTQNLWDAIADQGGSGGTGGNAGVYTVEKQGAGTLTLTGANTYSGGTTISGGALQGNTISLQGNITNNASLIFDQAVNGMYAGIVSGTGALGKQNAGTLALTGANTYSGGTTITGGALQGNTTSLQGNITNNTSLVFDQAVDGTYSGIVSGTGALIKQNMGTLTLTSANTYRGGTSVTQGTLLVNGRQPGSAVTVAAGATLGGSGAVGATSVSGTCAPAAQVSNKRLPSVALTRRTQGPPF